MYVVERVTYREGYPCTVTAVSRHRSEEVALRVIIALRARDPEAHLRLVRR